MTHAVKTWIPFFKAQESGEKLFELRKDDRPYEVGDYFLSQEFDSTKNKYTGREKRYVISYILREAKMFGLKKGYCILNLQTIDL